MPLQATCPNCEANYTLRDEMRGKTVRCKKCQKPFVAGGAVKAKIVDDNADEPPAKRPGQIQSRPGSAGPPVKARPADEKPRRRRDEDDDTDDEDDDVRPRKKKSALPLILGGAGVGALVLLLVCGGVLYWAMSGGGDEDEAPQAGGAPAAGPAGGPVKPPADLPTALNTLKKSTDHFRRTAALQWLAQADPDDQHRAEVIQAVEPIIAGDDVFVGEAATKALAHWATREQVPNLLNVLGSRSGGARTAAIEALGRLKDERAIAPLAGRLADLGDRAAAGRALEAFGPAAEKEVLKNAFHKDPGCREEARRLLKGYGTKDGELLNQALLALKSADRESRKAALEWLDGAAVDPQLCAEVTEALDPLTQDSDGFSRDPAAKATAHWATRGDTRAAPTLARHLADAFNAGVYGKALETIGPAAEPDVLKYYFDPNGGAQQEARRVCRAFGTKQDAILAQAVAEIKDAGGDDKRQVPVCTWLGQTPPDEKNRADVARALDPLLKSSNQRVREEAVKAVVTWGTKDNVDTLISLVQDGDFFKGPVRKPAIQALGNIKDDRAAPVVAARLTDFFDRETAAAALKTMGPGAEKAVLPLVNSDDAGVRVLACRVLEAVGTKDSLKLLELHAKGDRDPNARTAAAMAYTAIKARP